MAVTCLTTERKTSEDDDPSEVRQKITLNYEKLELENKLNEMTKAIKNIKKQYVKSGSASSPPSASRASNFIETNKSRKSACSPRSGERSHRSRSPPKHIVPK